MRFAATVFLWLATTALLAVVVPTMWAQRSVVSEDGYAALAASAAKEPALQQAMADELATQLVSLGANSGFDVSSDLLLGAATAYTRSQAFPGQFAAVNRIVHRWMFTENVAQSDESGRWVIDLSPMLADGSFQQTLRDFGIEAPSTLTVPLTENAPDELRPGELRYLSRWGPWISVGSTILTGVFALLMLAAARSRGKALAALGVSALLVGGAGWAVLEVARGRIDEGLSQITGDIRQVADAMVGHALGSLHTWLNLTLAAGGVLVVFGILVSMLGGLRRRD